MTTPFESHCRKSKELSLSCLSISSGFLFSPITYSLDAGVALANSSDYVNYCVTKREYEDQGVAICHRKFADNS